MVHCPTVADLIEHSGGINVVAQRYNVKTGTVFQWKYRKRVPKDTYVSWHTLMERLRITAPDSLWGQR